MCFSPTASFVAGSALTAVGVVTIKKAKLRAEVPFAMIPLFFGIQQLTEGLVWLSLQFDAIWLNTTMSFIYSLFAYVFWPTYIPLAVQSLETVPWRKKILSLFQLVGILVGAYFLYFHIQIPVTSLIVNKSIVYVAPHFDALWVQMFYLAATCISALFSSHKLVNIFGTLVFIFAIVAYQFYTVSFVSVWCYFAAILSGIIYLYFLIKVENKNKVKTKRKI